MAKCFIGQGLVNLHKEYGMSKKKTTKQEVDLKINAGDKLSKRDIDLIVRSMGNKLDQLCNEKYRR